MKKYILIIMFCVSFFAASAQKNDTLVRNIQIERDYVPEVAKVARPDVSLSNIEPQVEKSAVKFSEFSSPFSVERAEFIPLSPQNLTSVNRESAKSGFLRVGAGALFTWLADLWYPVWDSRDGYFDLAVHHDAILGVVKPTKKLFNTGLEINFRRNFGEHQFYLSSKYDNELFNYYGNDTAVSNHYPAGMASYFDSIYKKNQSFNKIDFTLGMRSNRRTDTGWLYDASLNYHLHNIAGSAGAANLMSNTSEHNINAAVRADIQWENHHLDVETGIATYFYSSKNRNIPLHWKPNTVVRLLPAYLLNSKKIHLRLGLKAFFNFNKGAVVAVAPDVKIDYFFKDFLNLYAGVTGDYHVNSIANITAENRYFNFMLDASKSNTYTPVNVFGGFKVKVAKGLMFDAFLGYKYINNKIFFVNNYDIFRTSAEDFAVNIFSKTFSTVKSTGTLFNAGIRVSYDIRERINIFAQMKYNGWHLTENIYLGTHLGGNYAWHTPALEANAGADFKIGKKFFGNIIFYAASKTNAMRNIDFGTDNNGNPTTIAETVSLPARFDLNLGFGCNIKKNISLFAQANNVLALSPKLNYQTWYGYNSFGAHFLIGATILF
jgi:hypothetical protein